MDPFSRRTRFDSAENALTQALSQARAQGRPLLDLSVSNVTEVGLSLDADTLGEALRDPDVATYAPEPFGLMVARAALSARERARGFEIAPEQIMLTASSSEAYGYLFKLLCDPGDCVLVPAPSYPLLDVLAALEGVRLIPYSLHYDGEWHLDSSLVALAKESKARAIVTVHPNNPTGSFLKRQELVILAQCGLPILSDEVFSDYGFAPDTQRAVSALELRDCLVFCMGGMSKALGLPQLKLAWTLLSGPAAQVHEACMRLEHIADSYLSPSTPVQRALPRLLTQAPRLQAEIRARCLHNLAELRARCTAATGISTLQAEGGWYAILRLPHVLDDDAWALCLLEQDGVVTQPGYFYGMSRGAHLVLSLITPPDLFARGVAQLVARVREVCERS
jgi:alanine-synthesizing transaminase